SCLRRVGCRHPVRKPELDVGRNGRVEPNAQQGSTGRDLNSSHRVSSPRPLLLFVAQRAVSGQQLSKCYKDEHFLHGRSWSHPRCPTPSQPGLLIVGWVQFEQAEPAPTFPVVWTSPSSVGRPSGYAISLRHPPCPGFFGPSHRNFTLASFKGLHSRESEQ